MRIAAQNIGVLMSTALHTRERGSSRVNLTVQFEVRYTSRNCRHDKFAHWGALPMELSPGIRQHRQRNHQHDNRQAYSTTCATSSSRNIFLHLHLTRPPDIIQPHCLKRIFIHRLRQITIVPTDTGMRIDQLPPPTATENDSRSPGSSRAQLIPRDPALAHTNRSKFPSLFCVNIYTVYVFIHLFHDRFLPNGSARPALCL